MNWLRKKKTKIPSFPLQPPSPDQPENTHPCRYEDPIVVDEKSMRIQARLFGVARYQQLTCWKGHMHWRPLEW